MELWKKIICILSIIAVIVSFGQTKLHASAPFNISSQSTKNGNEYRNVYRYKRNSHMMIALTFDDGPHPYYTDRILDILKKYNVKATFFMIGENVEYYTKTALRVKNEGHEIGNHTEKHLSARNASEEMLISDIVRCNDIIFKALGCKPTLTRPPEGAIVNAVLRTCDKLDYSVILWNVDTRDWAHTSPKDIYKNVIQNTDSGDIILMHDYISKNSPTPEALEMIIPKLLDEGFRFVTVSELIMADD